MKLLVLATEPVSAHQLRDAVGDDSDPEDYEVMVVAPALQDSPIRFWTSDADDAIARAQEVSDESVRDLGDAGVAASGDTGESDPLKAIQDALQTFPADRILVFRREDSQQRYREDVDGREIEDRFGVPVTVVPVTGSTA